MYENLNCSDGVDISNNNVSLTWADKDDISAGARKVPLASG